MKFHVSFEFKIYLLIIFIALNAGNAFAGNSKNKKIDVYESIDKISSKINDSSTTSTKKIANFINNNFSSEADKIRSIFYITANSIEYDIDNMFALNFYESRKEKIEKAIKLKKGICEAYACIFNELCSLSNIKSYVIEGYTKQNGFTDYIPHAWNAAYIDTSWYLFDATWGSGYISENNFIKQLDNKYFKVEPKELVKSHMPFDPLFQFMYYPLTSKDFYNQSKNNDNAKTYFNYKDSLKLYDSLPEIENIKGAYRRIENNGVKNAMVFNILALYRQQIDNYINQEKSNFYNDAIIKFNNAVEYYNNFINYRNKQFQPITSDNKIQNMIDVISINIDSAKYLIGKINSPSQELSNLIVTLNKSMSNLGLQLKEQQEFLSLYFKKNKVARKAMFYTIIK